MAFDRRPREPELPEAAKAAMPVEETEQIAQPFVHPAAFAAPTGAADPTALLPWMDDDLAVRHAPPTQVADARDEIPKGAKYDPRWVSMAEGTIHEDHAPSAVQLPDGVVKGLDRAWDTSQAENHDERGGNIVKTYWGGNYQTRQGGDLRNSDNDTFEPKRTDELPGQKHIGTYHTHDSTHDKQPYDTVTFSNSDVANMSTMEDRVKIVRSGKETYMLARTKEFEAMEKQVDGDTERENEFHDEMHATYLAAYNAVLKGDPANFQAASEAGVQAAAAKYHLLYYKGQGARLQRVGGEPPSK